MALLEWAASGKLQTRREYVSDQLGMTLCYISDLHLSGTWTSRVCQQVLDGVTALRPDLVLLGGDLVDRKKALPQLKNLVAELKQLTSAVLVIPGNHDHFVGVGNVRDAVLDQGAHWLPDEAYRIAGLVVEAAGHLEKRQEESTVNILCGHEPSVAMGDDVGHIDLVLAGHLHGCQWVLWRRKGELYPGAFVYRWNGPRFQVNRTTVLVSQGVNDTFPLRWNCPREVLYCLL